MVIQRTLDKIEELKERPHEDRKAVAFAGSLIVMAVLLVGWGAMALRSVAPDSQTIAETDGSQAASAAAAFPISDSEELLYASSSDGYVDLVSESEMSQ